MRALLSAEASDLLRDPNPAAWKRVEAKLGEPAAKVGQVVVFDRSARNSGMFHPYAVICNVSRAKKKKSIAKVASDVFAAHAQVEVAL